MEAMILYTCEFGYSLYKMAEPFSASTVRLDESDNWIVIADHYDVEKLQHEDEGDFDAYNVINPRKVRMMRIEDIEKLKNMADLALKKQQ